MESIKESLSALANMFNVRTHEFQQDLSNHQHQLPVIFYQVILTIFAVLFYLR